MDLALESASVSMRRDAISAQLTRSLIDIYVLVVHCGNLEHAAFTSIAHRTQIASYHAPCDKFPRRKRLTISPDVAVSFGPG